MTWEKFWENFETIDNEQQKINETLDKKEDLVALGVIEAIDKQIPNIDLDLAIDRENNKYYFISNWNDHLNISIDFKDLPEIWSILVKLLNNDIHLFWDLNWRSIAKDTMMPDWLEEKFISDWKLTKNEIEELFIFVMNAKWIPMEDWQLEDTICKWWVNNACKQALWN